DHGHAHGQVHRAGAERNGPAGHARQGRARPGGAGGDPQAPVGVPDGGRRLGLPGVEGDQGGEGRRLRRPRDGGDLRVRGPRHAGDGGGRCHRRVGAPDRTEAVAGADRQDPDRRDRLTQSAKPASAGLAHVRRRRLPWGATAAAAGDTPRPALHRSARMTVTLYGSRSTASLVVHWLLIELGVAHELRLLDFDQREHKSADYLALNPQGRVPTLVIDGQVLTESAAIAMHLADLHPSAGLAPAPGTPERAAYYRWMFFCAYTLMPAYRRWFYPHEPAGEDQIAQVQARALAELETAWQQVDTHLAADGPYLLGDQRSAAD